MRQPYRFGELRGAYGAFDHCIQRHLLCVEWLTPLRILIHQFGEEAFVQGTPVNADPNRLVILDRDVHDCTEVLIPPAGADVAGVDPILGQRARALWILREQQVPVVMEVADDGDRDVLLRQAGHYGGNSPSGSVVVNRHPHQLTTGSCKVGHLCNRRVHVGGVSISHRLHDDGMPGSDRHVGDPGGDCLSANYVSHGRKYRARGGR